VSSFTSVCDACTVGGCAVPTPGPTPTPTPVPTPTPQPNVCGNGVVDPGEECDGPTCVAMVEGFPQTSECGAPGTLHACQCRDVECGFLPGAVLCWDSDQCLPRPGPEIGSGQCIATTCQSTSDCNDPDQCQNGACCVPLSSGGACSFETILSLPCCGAAICVNGSPFGTCCLPSGQACGSDAECCNGTCAGGTCN
jgi:hypothetical protein